MKLLILSPPRVASKWVFRNFCHYLSYPHLIANTTQFTDFSVPNVNHFEQVIKRSGYGGGNLIAKHHDHRFILGESGYDEQLRFYDSFDKVIYLRRDPSFDMSLSLILSDTKNAWLLNKEMVDTINELRKKPVTIPLSLYAHRYTWFSRMFSFNYERALTVNFRDYTKLTNAEDFCSLFEVAPKAFQFTMPEIEWGDKRVLIENYDELKEYYETREHELLKL